MNESKALRPLYRVSLTVFNNPYPMALFDAETPEICATLLGDILGSVKSDCYPIKIERVPPETISPDNYIE